MTPPTWVPLLAAALLVLSITVAAGADTAWIDDHSSYEYVVSEERLCEISANCTNSSWEAPYPQCIDGKCVCPNGTCMTIEQYSTLGTGSEKFFCGECGSFGAKCSSSEECLPTDSSCENHYCVCNYGSSLDGVCTVIVTKTSASATNLVLTGILLLIIICNKCMSSQSMQRRWRRFVRRCRRRNSEERTICQIDADGTYHNPRGSDKTPSYSLGNQEFYASSDDPDLDWAIELSLLEQTRRRSASNSIRMTPLSPGEQNAVTSSDEEPSLHVDEPENMSDNITENTAS